MHFALEYKVLSFIGHSSIAVFEKSVTAISKLELQLQLDVQTYIVCLCAL